MIFPLTLTFTVAILAQGYHLQYHFSRLPILWAKRHGVVCVSYFSNFWIWRSSRLLPARHTGWHDCGCNHFGKLVVQLHLGFDWTGDRRCVGGHTQSTVSVVRSCWNDHAWIVGVEGNRPIPCIQLVCQGTCGRREL